MSLLSLYIFLSSASDDPLSAEHSFSWTVCKEIFDLSSSKIKTEFEDKLTKMPSRQIISQNVFISLVPFTVTLYTLESRSCDIFIRNGEQTYFVSCKNS